MRLAIVSYVVIILLNAVLSKKFFAFKKYEGQQCWGVGNDVERDFVGDEAACKQRCKDLDCVGFVRVNSGSKYAGKCYFRGEGLQDPYDYAGDDRDCYRTVAYEIYEGEQCWGEGDDILRDFVGEREDCALECDARDDCVGFVRVNSGSQYAGKCYFRGEGLQDPYPYAGDDRDCFEPIDLTALPNPKAAAISPGYDGYDYGYNQGQDNDYYKIIIDSNTAMMIGGLLIIVLLANLACMTYKNCKGSDKTKGWKRMKFAEGSNGRNGTESEVSPIV